MKLSDIATPPGAERFYAETFTVKDRAGMIRDRGLKTREAADEVVDRLADDPGAHPCTIERVTHLAFTLREVISPEA